MDSRHLREKERKRERKREREKERKRERLSEVSAVALMSER